jgi:DNA-binding MarR family transcriptional regulator
MDTELVARLRAVIPRLARVLNDTSTGEDLTPTQYSVLALVRVRGPLGLTELTELEGLNPTMLSRVVKALDERGLIRRMPDPGDLRAARVAATADGERVHDRVRNQRTKVLSDCLHGLPPDTTAALLAAVPDLEVLAEALKPPAKPAKTTGLSRTVAGFTEPVLITRWRRRSLRPPPAHGSSRRVTLGNPRCR